MQKVITINLNGVAYQVDESGYGALVAYLEGAERQLKDNPDRAEIIADLEQAIADKCRGFLGPNKTVVSSDEVTRIINEMGPVDAGSGASTGGGAEPRPGSAGPARPSRRLYRIEEGAMWEGVCNGLAAYTGIHVAIVRILFLLVVVWTGGLALIGYWILASSIPEAVTADERAAAHGQAPFNAQDLVDRAKTFTNPRDWKRKLRQERRAWRQQRRASRWQAPHMWGAPWAPPAPLSPGTYGTRMMTGLLVPVLSIVSALFFWFWLWAIYSLVTTGEVLGQALPDDMPLWGGILILVILYQAIAWPLHSARRRASYYSAGGADHGFLTAWDGMMQLTFGIAIVWLAYYYSPQVREIIHTLPDVWNSLVSS
jgi:phage shock protein PspC (stress-responsive transcriptional regulator)